MVPWTILDEQLHELSLPRRHATEYLEYSKDNYWTSDSMIDHAIQIALPIFQTLFQAALLYLPLTMLQTVLALLLMY